MSTGLRSSAISRSDAVTDSGEEKRKRGRQEAARSERDHAGTVNEDRRGD